MIFTKKTDCQYNPIDIIKGNQISKKLNKNSNLTEEKRKKLFETLTKIHNGLINELTAILEEKFINYYKKYQKNFQYTLDTELDISKVIYLNQHKNEIDFNLEKEIIYELNKFQNTIIDIRYQNFINTLN